MTGNIETEQETRERMLSWMQAEMLKISNLPCPSDDTSSGIEREAKLNELDAGMAELELQIGAFREGYDKAIITHSWRQLMFLEIRVIPIDEDEIPF